MGNTNSTRIVLGSLRFKSSPNTDLAIQVPFKSTQRELIEYDRVTDVNLQQLFQDERENSNLFRPSCKFQVIFKNVYSGTTNYPPFENNLYYINAIQTIQSRCTLLNNQSPLPFSGYPTYNEFDFIRNDYDITGYTSPPNPHVNFVTKSASSYNWNFYVSYASSNDFKRKLRAQFLIPDTNNPQYPIVNWIVSDGIPFVTRRRTYNGRNLISFRCPLKHGLSVGEFVQLSRNFLYDNNRVYQVYRLGDNTFGSDDYVFNIIDYGYTGTTFNSGRQGTAKRVLNVNNIDDSISTYYVRKHKLLTEVDESLVVKTGFEENVFNTVKKYESSGATPNGVARIAVKEGSQSYTLAFNKQIDIAGLLDNQKRPLTELFFTVIWSGYFGWTFGIRNPRVRGASTGLSPLSVPSQPYYGLKQGWEFNLPLQPNSNTPSTWWKNTEVNSDTGFPIGVYNNGLFNRPNFNGFTFIRPLRKGWEIDGEICEWNNYEQKERVVSDLYHKIKFNPFVFSINTNTAENENPRGYYYKPHYSLPITVFSDYIEEAPLSQIDSVPNYAYFSTNLNTFRWRDIYSYGYVDSTGRGYNYPFLNRNHYPYSNYTFRIIPEGFVNPGPSSIPISQQPIIQQPTTDDCE